MNISIITPFYKGNTYLPVLAGCLAGNAARLLPSDRVELLLVNDCPEEAVDLSLLAGAGLAAEAASKTAPAEVDAGAPFALRVISNEENIGIHASRLRGLAEASGDWILFLDQDDVLSSNALSRWKAFVEKETARQGRPPRAAVCNARLEQADGSELLWFRTSMHKELLNDYGTWLSVGTQIISPGQVLLRKNAISEFWKTHVCRINGSDDLYLWILMLADGSPFSYLDEPLYTHSYTGENLSADTEKTDTSIREFLTFLPEAPGVSDAACRMLLRTIDWKAAFRSAGFAGKLWQLLSHPDLSLVNALYKLTTGTKYGFNR